MVFILFLVLIMLDASGVKVPAPTRVVIEAYNFDTVVSWNYPSMLQTPIFTVQVKNYGEAVWADACSTSNFSCNISSTINDPSKRVLARVKARLGQAEGAYVQTKEFILCKQGKIGPPKLDCRHKKDKIIVAVFHPLVTANGKEPIAIYGKNNTCHTFIYKYNVSKRINGSLIKVKADTLKEDDCNETQCHSSISVSSPNSEYHISVEGYSDTWAVQTENFEKFCITVPDHKSIKDSVWIPIVAAFLLFLGLFLVVVCCSIKKINLLKRKSITSPKSLVSSAKTPSSELICVPPVICEPVVPKNERVTWGRALGSSNNFSVRKNMYQFDNPRDVEELQPELLGSSDEDDTVECENGSNLEDEDFVEVCSEDSDTKEDISSDESENELDITFKPSVWL